MANLNGWPGGTHFMFQHLPSSFCGLEGNLVPPNATAPTFQPQVISLEPSIIAILLSRSAANRRHLWHFIARRLRRPIGACAGSAPKAFRHNSRKAIVKSKDGIYIGRAYRNTGSVNPVEDCQVPVDILVNAAAEDVDCR